MEKEKETAYTHVDVPWRVGHDNMKFAQYGIVESA